MTYVLTYSPNESLFMTMEIEEAIVNKFNSFEDLFNYYYSKNSKMNIYVKDLYIFAQESIKQYFRNYNYNDSHNIHLLKDDEYTYSFGNSTSVCYFISTKHNKKEIQFIGIDNIIPKQDLQSLHRTFGGNNGLEAMAEAAKFLESLNNKGRTIGKIALNELKNSFSKTAWDIYFPHQENEVDKFIRESFVPGWLYYNDNRSHEYTRSGKTYDVNSLFPYVMRNFDLPYGNPTYFTKTIPTTGYYFVRLKAAFTLKERAFPFIRDNCTKQFLSSSERREIILSKDTYEMFLKYYNIRDLEIIDGYSYKATHGLFNKYIDKWFTIKCNSTGAKRLFSKLMLNNIYGKFGAKPETFMSEIELTDENSIMNVGTYKPSETLYIPIASSVASIANRITIEAAIANYDNFIFAHTDSIHLLGDSVNGIEIDDVELGKWKIEREWSDAYFTPDYNYIEHETNGSYYIAYFGLRDTPRKQLEDLLSNNTINYYDIYKGIILKDYRYLRSSGRFETTTIRV